MPDIFHAVLCVAEIYCTREYMAPRTPCITYGTIAPPPKYDIPYTGELTIWIAPQQMIDDTCKSKDGKYTSHTACAQHLKNECRVWMLKEIVEGKRFDTVATDGHVGHDVKFSLELTLRHEIAHCNGWPGDHPDGKRMPQDTTTKMPELPLSTRWLPAYPPTVCITPDRRIEECKTRPEKPDDPTTIGWWWRNEKFGP
jgi:hypothetical protein